MSVPRTRPAHLLAWAALVVVYVVWGSTYLAIRVGVRDLPPLTMAGVRYVIAGALLYPVALRSGGAMMRRSDRPGRREWAAATVVGLLLLVLGNGGLSVGERSLDSGLAAVLVATVPLWMVLLAWPIARSRPTGRALIGLAVGLVGVAVLAGAGFHSGHLAGVIVVLGASAAWGLGSVLAHRLPLPRRALVAAATEMIAGGVLLLIVAALHGDLIDVGWSHVPASAWWALLYLIGPGSVLAFTAYGYALAHLPIATVSTYAYVNPVVAVLLGFAILNERLSLSELLGTGLVVVAVLITLRRRLPSQEPNLANAEPVADHDPER